MAATFQLEIDDTSPATSYFPYGDTFAAPDLSDGWNPFYTDSGYVTSPGAMGNGTSEHRTAHDGAVLTLQWTGTGIQLFGAATGASYGITLDGNVQVDTGSSSEQSLLAAFSNLSDESHVISITAHINSTTSLLSFDKAIITASTNRTGATVTTQIVNDTTLEFQGQWNFVRDSNLDISYHISSNKGDESSLSFQGAAIVVGGIRDTSYGFYNVTLDGITTQYNAESSFNEMAALFFQAGLDPTVSHHITVTNADDKNLAIYAMNVTQVSGGSPIASPVTPSVIPTGSLSMSAGYSRGTIAALAVAGVLGFLIFLALVFLIQRRHRRRLLHSPEEPDVVEIAIAKGRRPLTYTLDLPAPLPRPPREYAPASQRETRTGTLSTSVAATGGHSHHEGGGGQIHPYAFDIAARYHAWYKSNPDVEVEVEQIPHVTVSTAAEGVEPIAGTSRRHKRGLSFLDFASSASSSLRAKSHSRSRANSASNGSSGSSSRRGKRAVRQSRSTGHLSISIIDNAADNGTPPHLTPNLSASRRNSRQNGTNSPTDSVPLTVSDIAFRHEADAEEDISDRRTSGSHLPPHPPLPIGSPRIVQMLLGRSQSEGSGAVLAPRPGPGVSPGFSPGYTPGRPREY